MSIEIFKVFVGGPGCSPPRGWGVGVRPTKTKDDRNNKLFEYFEPNLTLLTRNTLSSGRKKIMLYNGHNIGLN